MRESQTVICSGAFMFTKRREKYDTRTPQLPLL
jgi:hypothetical protein